MEKTVILVKKFEIEKDKEEKDRTSSILAGFINPPYRASLVLDGLSVIGFWLVLKEELKKIPGFNLEIERTSYSVVDAPEVLEREIKETQTNTVLIICQPEHFEKLKQSFQCHSPLRNIAFFLTPPSPSY